MNFEVNSPNGSGKGTKLSQAWQTKQVGVYPSYVYF